MKANLDLQKHKKLIIAVAQTGGIHGKEANPALPEQPEEIAQSAHDCYNAGASVVHIHARDKDGNTTGDLNVYERILSGIKKKCPIITQVGNGIGVVEKADGSQGIPELDYRLKLTEIEPKPDMLTVNCGTFEFGWLGSSFENPLYFNEEFIKRCNKRNIPIECECYDLSHINNMLELVNRGVLNKPVHFSFVLGIKGGIPATPESINAMLDMIPQDSTWQVITISKLHVPSTVMAMCMGANVRTGLEDTIYYSRGVLAESNAQLVERMVRVAKEIGREVATVDEAKDMLGIEN